MESRIVNAIELRKTQPLALRQRVDDRRFRAVVLDLGVDPFDAVLVDDPRLPHRLRQQRYPQMQEQLADRIERDGRNRHRHRRRRDKLNR